MPQRQSSQSTLPEDLPLLKALAALTAPISMFIGSLSRTEARMNTRTACWCGAALMLGLLVAGCGLNSVRPLPPGATVRESTAVLVYGVGLEAPWRAPVLAVRLDEYDLETHRTRGDCYRDNHTRAVVPGTPGPIRYFAFEVPPGHYVYSAFNGAYSAVRNHQAYAAPAGRIVYVGDFVYGKDQRLALRRDLAAFERKRHEVLQGLEGEVTLARSTPATARGIYVCAP